MAKSQTHERMRCVRFNDEYEEMLAYLVKRLKMKSTQVQRHAVLRLYQAERAAEKRQSK